MSQWGCNLAVYASLYEIYSFLSFAFIVYDALFLVTFISVETWPVSSYCIFSNNKNISKHSQCIISQTKIVHVLSVVTAYVNFRICMCVCVHFSVVCHRLSHICVFIFRLCIRPYSPVTSVSIWNWIFLTSSWSSSNCILPISNITSLASLLCPSWTANETQYQHY